jgi:hypothetical protein
MARYFLEFRNKLCLVVALPCLLCCVTVAQSVRTSRAAGVDFSKFHTYRWVQVKGPHPDPNIDAQIRQSVDSQLATKGLKLTTEDSADLSIDYQAAISEETKWQSYEDWSDASFVAQRIGKTEKVTLNQGTLDLDMYDTAAKNLVWNARGTKTLDTKSSPEDRKKRLDQAVKKMLQNFPPK